MSDNLNIFNNTLLNYSKYPELISLDAANKITAVEKFALDNYYARWNYLLTERRRFIIFHYDQSVTVTKFHQLQDKSNLVFNPNKKDTSCSLNFNLGINGISIMYDVLDVLYDKLCEFEFNRINNDLKKDFNSKVIFAGTREVERTFDTPWKYYQYLRPGYVALKFKDPVSILNQIDTNATFLGRRVVHGVHPVFLRRLRSVESTLDESNSLYAVYESIKDKEIGGFVPRYISGSNDLSLHALGISIDIDSPTNPFIVGNKGIVINKILSYLEYKGKINPVGRVTELLKEEFFGKTISKDDRLREISEALQLFLKEEMPKLNNGVGISSNITNENNDDGISTSLIIEFINVVGWKEVETYRDKGIIDIPFELFDSFRKNKVDCGSDWKGKKDTMHFEISPNEIR